MTMYETEEILVRAAGISPPTPPQKNKGGVTTYFLDNWAQIWK